MIKIVFAFLAVLALASAGYLSSPYYSSYALRSPYAYSSYYSPYAYSYYSPYAYSGLGYHSSYLYR